MSFDNAYEALAEENDARWAFGISFDTPVSEVDAPLPSNVDGPDLAAYCLMLGDDALVMSQRLQRWCTNAPELEDEVALANIALDLLGQTRVLYARAGVADGSGRGEDFYAYFRAESEFRNVRLAELASSDFAELIAQLLAFSVWRLELLRRLCASADPALAALGEKGTKEVAYHRDYAARWVVRLGDGTEFSHGRMRAGLTIVWPLVDELFAVTEIESRLADAGMAVDPSSTRADFDAVLDQVLATATLARPEVAPFAGVSGKTGREGVHTEAMGYLLAELQSVARAHQGATW